MFHLLVDAASREVVNGNGQNALRGAVARALNHGEMKKACQALASWNRNNPLVLLGRLLPQEPSADVQTIASVFVELQQARHEADYDLMRRLSRSETLDFLSQAELAFSAFRNMQRGSDQRRVLLLSLVFQGRWRS